MTLNNGNKPAIWFWVVSIIALFWNAMGVDQYLGQAYETERWQAAMTSEQLELASSTPAWITAAFAIAVFSATIASIGLLLRKGWAYPLFVLSFITVVIQMGYFFAKGITDNIGMTISIIVFALFLVWFSKHSKTKKWIY